MQNTWLVLLPPLIVLFLAFITRKTIFSLICGIFAAALVFNNFSIFASLKTVASRIWTTSELASLKSYQSFINSWNPFVCLFLITLGIIVVLITYSGGAYAYAQAVKKKLKNKNATETSSLLLSLFFFIDDYLSSLTVGSVMSPLSDKFKIPRAKLAYLVDSMAAPLCIITPISSWSAYIVMHIKKAGLAQTFSNASSVPTPFLTFLKTIPFIFYSFITITGVWFIVRHKISIGEMNKHETIAANTGNLFAGKIPNKKEIHNEKNVKKDYSILDFLLPITTLIICAIGFILYFGNSILLGGSNNLLQTLQVTHTPKALFMGGICSLFFSIVFFLFKRKLGFRDLKDIFKQGFSSMFPTVIVLILAWSLSEILKNDLQTGQYLASLLVGALSINLLPVIFFVITAITAFAMGSAWGSAAVMIPIALPMLASFVKLNPQLLQNDFPLLFSVLGAVLSGAVSGNHTSPVSDTTIMSATSTGCYHMDHVKTQYTYSVPVLFCTATAFLISGFLSSYNIYLNIAVSLATGIFCNFTYLWIRNYWTK